MKKLKKTKVCKHKKFVLYVKEELAYEGEMRSGRSHVWSDGESVETESSAVVCSDCGVNLPLIDIADFEWD